MSKRFGAGFVAVVALALFAMPTASAHWTAGTTNYCVEDNGYVVDHIHAGTGCDIDTGELVGSVNIQSTDDASPVVDIQDPFVTEA